MKYLSFRLLLESPRLFRNQSTISVTNVMDALTKHLHGLGFIR